MYRFILFFPSEIRFNFVTWIYVYRIFHSVDFFLRKKKERNLSSPLAFHSLYDIEDKIEKALSLQDWRKENVQAVKGVLNYEKADAPFAASCLINGVCCISEAMFVLTRR